ncbi:hypothetical protein SPHINGO8BC_90469 [Sphingobacterium multivorum]|uniref:Uncharacterized protein n=1 Tax=Sphingobacterium multivorum TaxID=28454 RepID=A0A654DT11_SPHMU|nr:hypothetical protein SPHINGO8BC_90469 [Sphingobacterium multivorum]
MQDGNRCAQRFIDAMNHEQPDFIISLSDFCVPKGDILPHFFKS